jgi:hypothetical protein
MAENSNESNAASQSADTECAKSSDAPVSKTKLDLDACKKEVADLISQTEVEKKAEESSKTDAPVAKTKLDLDECKQVVTKLISQKEEQHQELLKELSKAPRASEPLKPESPIENYKLGTPCSVTWEQMEGSERFRVCSKCTLHVYDLRNMSQQDAEQVVFQREGKAATTYYKRKDGRFMTSDCPVALAIARRNLVLAIVGLILLAGMVAFIALMPHSSPPPPPTAAHQPGGSGQTSITRAGTLPQPDATAASEQSAGETTIHITHHHGSPVVQPPTAGSPVGTGAAGQLQSGANNSMPPPGQ